MIMIVKLCLVMSAFCLLLSCNTKSNKDISLTPLKEEVNRPKSVLNIDVAEVIKKPEKFTIPYSSCVKDIRYVPLETTDNSLVGEGRHGIVMCVTQDMIVADMKVFDGKDGHFLFNLSQRGQGPKEYTYIKTVVGDDSRKEFYIHDHAGSKIMVYGYDGEYKYTVGGQGGYEIIPLGNGNILINRDQVGSIPYFDYFVMNLDSQEILYKHVSSALRKSGDINKCKGIVKSGIGESVIMGMNRFWKYNDHVYYYEYLTDSLFVINNQFQPDPIGSLNMSGLKMTTEQWQLPLSQQDFYIWNIRSFMETNDYLFIRLDFAQRVRGESGNYIIVYDKKNGSIKTSKQNEFQSSIFQNDINYSDDYMVVFFTPVFDNKQEDVYVYRFVSPTYIKESVTVKESPNMSKNFQELGKKLKDDDNPVVCIMTLK